MPKTRAGAALSDAPQPHPSAGAAFPVLTSSEIERPSRGPTTDYSHWLASLPIADPPRTFLRGCYGWNSPNWLPPRTAGGQRPEMWQEPLEMSGFLQAQTRTSKL